MMGETVEIATQSIITILTIIPSTPFMWLIGLALVLTILANIYHWLT